VDVALRIVVDPPPAVDETGVAAASRRTFPQLLGSAADGVADERRVVVVQV
jgi:hypothetical protein